MKVKCNCKHEQQDKLHGKGIRIANPVDKSRQQGKLTEVKCTVCSTVHKKWEE